MKLSKTFATGILISFACLLFILFLIAWISESYLAQSDCTMFRHFISEDEISYERVSIWFWSRVCTPRMLFIGSSESSDIHSLPFFLRQQGYKFDQFIGAHRGLKSLGYMMAHEVSKDRVDNLRILAFVNPIYYTPGPATMNAPMAYKSALSARMMNKYVRNSVYGVKENFAETIFVSAKGFLLDIMGLLDLKAFMPLRTKIHGTYSFKPDIPIDYDLKSGLYHYNSVRRFESDIDFNIEPTYTFSRVINENKNGLRVCLVLLPFNERFFATQGSKYRDQMAGFYSKFRTFFSGVGVIDLTSMGSEQYLFADTMHFTEYGASKIIQRVAKSACFGELWRSEN